MEITRCLEPGMSLLVGTVNTRNVPVCCRAVALTSSDDLASVTVYLPVATSSETIHNLAATRKMAIAATYPIDHCSIQLKGVPGDARLAREDEGALVRARFAAFVEVFDSIGIPAAVVRNISCWPAFAIDMRVEQVFDQTPGPNAGARLR